MNSFGETGSFTAACVCDREREGILDCRPSTLTSQGKWEENGMMNKNKHPSRCPPASPNLSPPLQSPHLQSLSIVVTPDHHLGLLPHPFIPRAFCYYHPTKQPQLVTSLLHITSHRSHGHCRRLLCGTLSGSSFLLLNCSFSGSFTDSSSFTQLFSVGVPQSHHVFDISYNLDKNVPLTQTPSEPQTHLPTWYLKHNMSKTEFMIFPILQTSSHPVSFMSYVSGECREQPRLGGAGLCFGAHSMGLGKQWVLIIRSSRETCLVTHLLKIAVTF